MENEAKNKPLDIKLLDTAFNTEWVADYLLEMAKTNFSMTPIFWPMPRRWRGSVRRKMHRADFIGNVYIGSNQT